MSNNYPSKISYRDCKYYKKGRCSKRNRREKHFVKGKCINDNDCVDFEPIVYFG